ncbi:formate dehydrogenase accessory sulfurtransferase FdhD [bacterium]|nr:formate dehydrogenase accessory sulfurtransferase FdhD [bacterium]NIN92613.1 formate dehydrogenase accessory sulfurtransferase FdhD [bacterium]NIO18638.1 formate dehydrogenase accessory sulfurtransferase FdhD [bacterium]NIO73660.1 formate dehydrogenase accessory sulfurtransferase FdhD [bacterium]
MRGNTHKLPILRSYRNKKKQVEDVLVKESSITIFYNGRKIVSLLCTPMELMELAVGFLFSEGILSHFEEIKWISEDPERGLLMVEGNVENSTAQPVDRVVTSGCGQGIFLFPSEEQEEDEISMGGISLSSDWISQLIKEFYKRSQLYLTTGGVHSCALANEGGIIIFSEDIGRHNALDKVAGKCVIEGIGTKDSIILTTGRVSAEMVIKAKRMNATFLISRGAPTDLSVAISKRVGITLIGFCRGERMNIYSHPERVIFEDNDQAA